MLKTNLDPEQKIEENLKHLRPAPIFSTKH